MTSNAINNLKCQNFNDTCQLILLYVQIKIYHIYKPKLETSVASKTV